MTPVKTQTKAKTTAGTPAAVKNNIPAMQMLRRLRATTEAPATPRTLASIQCPIKKIVTCKFKCNIFKVTHKEKRKLKKLLVPLKIIVNWTVSLLSEETNYRFSKD
jgi:hypothetical protein